MDEEIKKLNQKAQEHNKRIDALLFEISKIIVGQKSVSRKLMIALLCDGHVLLEGVPGLAKTLLIRTLAQTINLKFNRIQFTPDLLPADIVGTKIFNQKDSSFYTKKGPIFANFILADEINRAPPKVQSALLEAMQERQVTIGGDTHALHRPFLVLATQNPLETEGTYRLPEAQVDRFMFHLLIDYPSKEEEIKIIERYTRGQTISIKEILKQEEILELQQFTPKVYADDKIIEYVARIVEATRNPQKYGLDLNGLIEYGASPRASIWLILASKARAILSGRGYVLPEDVQDIAHDVLRHRVLLSFEAESESITSDSIIDKILDKLKVP